MDRRQPHRAGARDHAGHVGVAGARGVGDAPDRTDLQATRLEQLDEQATVADVGRLCEGDVARHVAAAGALHGAHDRRRGPRGRGVAQRDGPQREVQFAVPQRGQARLGVQHRRDRLADRRLPNQVVQAGRGVKGAWQFSDQAVAEDDRPLPGDPQELEHRDVLVPLPLLAHSCQRPQQPRLPFGMQVRRPEGENEAGQVGLGDRPVIGVPGRLDHAAQLDDLGGDVAGLAGLIGGVDVLEPDDVLGDLVEIRSFDGLRQFLCLLERLHPERVHIVIDQHHGEVVQHPHQILAVVGMPGQGILSEAVFVDRLIQ
ncbi:hypothetical protein [Dactylosporangium cerinum]